jgi:hypothetical protein
MTVAPPPVPAPAAPGQCTSTDGLPDPSCTPGATNPGVTQDNIGSTICQDGYTTTVRPPESYTKALKRIQMIAYGLSGSPSAYEEDHLIALELGGDSKDPKNLWPERGKSPNSKDHVEGQLHRMVCGGQMSLADAQHRIATDWKHAVR